MRHHVNLVQLNSSYHPLCFGHIRYSASISNDKRSLFTLRIPLWPQLSIRWGILQCCHIGLSLISIYSDGPLSCGHVSLVNPTRPWCIHASTYILTRNAAALRQSHDDLWALAFDRTGIPPFELITQLNHPCPALHFSLALINAPFNAKVTFVEPVTLLEDWPYQSLLHFFQRVLIIQGLARYEGHTINCCLFRLWLNAATIQVS